MALIGIIEDAKLDGIARRAIITVGDALHIVREGDELLDRFRVQSIGSVEAQLVDIADRQSLFLTLR